jgi:hypothetical protein
MLSGHVAFSFLYIGDPTPSRTKVKVLDSAAGAGAVAGAGAAFAGAGAAGAGAVLAAGAGAGAASSSEELQAAINPKADMRSSTPNILKLDNCFKLDLLISIMSLKHCSKFSTKQGAPHIWRAMVSYCKPYTYIMQLIMRSV